MGIKPCSIYSPGRDSTSLAFSCSTVACGDMVADEKDKLLREEEGQDGTDRDWDGGMLFAAAPSLSPSFSCHHYHLHLMVPVPSLLSLPYTTSWRLFPFAIHLPSTPHFPPLPHPTPTPTLGSPATLLPCVPSRSLHAHHLLPTSLLLPTYLPIRSARTSSNTTTSLALLALLFPAPCMPAT